MSDPVEIAAEALLGPVETRRDPKTLGGQWDRQQAPCAARSVLEALYAAGWRVVWINGTCHVCGVAGDFPHSHPNNGDNVHPLVRITDMWTPAVADAGERTR